MFKLFIVTLLIHSPLLLILGGISFGIANWSLQKQVFGRHLNLVLNLLLVALSVGILFGILRYFGLILFENDNFGSWNWFDSSFRDNGFKFIEICAPIFTGMIVASIFRSKKRITE